MTRKEDQSIEPIGIKPVKVMEVELSNALPVISALGQNNAALYGSALVLVRLHAQPMGLLKIDFQTTQISTQELAGLVWTGLGDRINRHLVEDGLPQLSNLTPQGLLLQSDAKCLQDRKALLENAPLISIILATRDRVQSLARALDSISELDYPRFEIVLVDSAPKSSETQDFFTINRARFTERDICIRYVREDVPGLAVAHNRGLEVARGSIIAFTDDDVLVDRNWLVELLRGFRSAPNVACVTGLVIPMELETPSQVLFEEFGGFAKGVNQVVYDMDSHRPSSALYPYTAGRFGTGANMAFRASYLEQVAGFDPALGVGTPTMGADDMAAFYQVIREGYQLVYQPSAIIMHRHRRSYEELRRQIYGYGSGLTAFLTKCVVDDPLSIFEIASKVPAGLKYAFGTDSNKNQHKSAEYPVELEGIERRGMLYGPFSYLKSRLRYRNERRHAAINSQKLQSRAIETAEVNKMEH